MEHITIDGKQYSLELKARMVEPLELSLKSKKSLLDIFMPIDVKVEKNSKDAEVGGLKFCSNSDLLQVFWAELQVNGTISIDEAYDLYDKFMDSKDGQELGIIGFYFLLGRAARFFTKESK